MDRQFDLTGKRILTSEERVDEYQKIKMKRLGIFKGSPYYTILVIAKGCGRIRACSIDFKDTLRL